MAESLAQWFVDLFGGKLSGELVSFIVSLFPILECRGGMIAAKIMDVPFVRAFILCYVGNMIPIPFILLFIKKIFALMKKNEKLGKFIEKIEAHGLKKADKVNKYKMLGLFILVAIPLPGTGGWTGALVASLLDLKIKHSLPVIAAGVLVAGFIMSALTYGLFSWA